MNSMIERHKTALQRMGIATEALEDVADNEYHSLLAFLKSKGIHEPINQYRVDIDHMEFWPRYCCMKRALKLRFDHAPSDQERIECENEYIADMLEEYNYTKDQHKNNQIEKPAI